MRAHDLRPASGMPLAARRPLLLGIAGLAAPALPAAAQGAQSLAPLRWVYPERAKPPLIAEAPSSAGFFHDLFALAGAEAGLTLQVERLPKARAWQQLQRGESDFYPGASFSAGRSESVLWTDWPGLRTREVCLLRPGLRLQGGLAQQRGLVIGVEPGSSKQELFPQHYFQPFGARLTVGKAVQVLAKGRADLVIVDIEPLRAYLRHGGAQEMQALGVHADERCLGDSKPLQLAWSRRALAPEGGAGSLAVARSRIDQSSLLPAGSRAGRFMTALKRIAAQGELARLMRQHGLG